MSCSTGIEPCRKQIDCYCPQWVYRLVYKQDRPQYYHYARDLLASHRVQACELRLVLGDGTPFWVHLMSDVEKDSPDTPVFRVVISDITARKKT